MDFFNLNCKYFYKLFNNYFLIKYVIICIKTIILNHQFFSSIRLSHIYIHIFIPIGSTIIKLLVF